MVTRTVIRITSSEAEHWAAIAAAAAGDNSAAIKKANNEQSKSSKSSAATSDQKDSQLQKRRKKTLCSHPSCNKRAQYPTTLCWRHGAKDVVCSFDGCNKRGMSRSRWVGAIMSMERMHQQGRLGKTGWNVLDAS